MKIEKHDEENFYDYPKCPHCGWDHEEWWDAWGEARDGETAEIFCQDCDKRFMSETSISVTFRSWKKKEA